MNKQPQPGKIVFAIVFGILFLIGIAILSLAVWYDLTFDISFKELLYTLLSPLKGTGESTVLQIVGAALGYLFVGGVLYALVCIPLFARGPVGRVFRDLKTKRKNRFLYEVEREDWQKNDRRRPVQYARQRALRRIGATAILLLLVFSLVFSVFVLRIPEYVVLLRQKTTIYEDRYVSPEDVLIEANGKPKNIIWLYMESMETAAVSKEEGGLEVSNLIPNLTALAHDNLFFSDQTDGKIGGFYSPIGTGWTIAALLASTSGVPFSFELGENGHNDMIYHEKFASGLTTFGDILERKGYRQEFLCGSDVRFGGRDLFYSQHGDFTLYDLFTARKTGAVAEDYHDGWWGLEDYILYDIAKSEILKLAESGDPFNFTFLTVDTHHANGHPCPLCQGRSGTRIDRVISCADRQAADFVKWCSEQDFFDDTLIVLTGDHPRMDKALSDPDKTREPSVYNCFINSAATPSRPTEGRTFTTFDLFPTVLSAMGFSVEGDRLGLGVNLFSDLPTLSEENGYDWLETEIRKFSSYYLLHFS
ncbi:MAG: LTA synthase family protein [Clostridia bacterium]|nr:LTA synthase family protein [Clostridia bacterium]